MLFLSKLLPIFIQPLGFAIFLAAMALVLSRLRRTSRLLTAATIMVLWVASAPAFADWLTSQLELVYPPVPVTQLPSADVAIILGGVIRPPVPPRVVPDLRDQADRIIEGWRLYHTDKVSAILVSGGNLPWSPPAEPEAVLVKRFLIELGVPGNDIAVETQSRNTHENAVDTARIMTERGWHSALLVTSGVHMPRAVATFRRAGVDVVPAATDIHAQYPFAESILDFLPDPDALADTTRAIKELLGLLYYHLRGWA